MRILYSGCLLTVLWMTACVGEDSDETGAGGGATTPSFAGQYTGTIEGSPVQLNLTVRGDQLNGTFTEQGEAYRVTGRIDGDRARGSVRKEDEGDSEDLMTFNARLAGDVISFEVDEDGDTLRFQITRIDGGAPPVVAASPPSGQKTQPQAPAAAPATARREPGDERDPRLVGPWRITIIHKSTFNMTTTYVNTWLDAKGRYQYGGSQSLITLENASGLAGNSDIETGEWKTGNGTLYYRHPPAKKWLVWGTYGISGGAVAFYPSGGGKQLWER